MATFDFFVRMLYTLLIGYLHLITIMTHFSLFYVIHYFNHFNSSDVSDAYAIGLLNEYTYVCMFTFKHRSDLVRFIIA